MTMAHVLQNDRRSMVLSWADKHLVIGHIPNWASKVLSIDGEEEEKLFCERLILHQLFTSSKGLSGEATQANDLYEVGFWESLKSITYTSDVSPMIYRLKAVIEKAVENTISEPLSSQQQQDEIHSWVYEYQRHLEGKRRDEKTIWQQCHIAQRFIRWLRNLKKFQTIDTHEINLYALQQEDVKLYLNYLRRMQYSGEMAETTASQVSSITLTFLRFCISKYGLHDVVGNLKGFSQGDTIDLWIPDQNGVKMFFQTIFDFSSRPLENFVLFGLQYLMGLRPGEAVGLHWEGVDLENGIVEFKGKGGHMVSMALVTPLCKALMLLRKNQMNGQHVFMSSKGKRLSSLNMRMRFRTFATIAGWTEECWPKTFRHSFCTHKLMETTDYLKVNRLARHTKMETTQRYIHFTKQHLQSAANQIHQNMEFKF